MWDVEANMGKLMVAGTRRDYGLGGLQDVPLGAAREKAIAIRRQAKAGLDPSQAQDSASSTPPPSRVLPGHNAIRVACAPDFASAAFLNCGLTPPVSLAWGW